VNKYKSATQAEPSPPSIFPYPSPSSNLQRFTVLPASASDFNVNVITPEKYGIQMRPTE